VIRAVSILLPLLLIGAMLGSILAGCADDDQRDPGAKRSDAAQDSAARAQVEAAEAEARAAHGEATAADAAAARARADALRAQAAADDERAAKMRAESEARAERARKAEIAADRDRLGWWLSAAGAGALALAAGASVLGWWLGLGRLTAGIGLGLAATGGIALALGMAWSWLPIAAAALLGLIIICAVIGILFGAGRHIAAHAERAATTDPDDTVRVDMAKMESAAEQIEGSTWTAVQRMRGKPLAEARAKLDSLRRRAGGYLPHEEHG
jgi:hypothetical protein